MDFNWGQPHGPMAPQLQAVTKPPMVKRPWERGPIILSLLKDAPPYSLSLYVYIVYISIYIDSLSSRFTIGKISPKSP